MAQLLLIAFLKSKKYFVCICFEKFCIMIIPPAPTSHSVHPTSIFPLLFSWQKALGKASENGHFCPQISSLPPLKVITSIRQTSRGSRSCPCRMYRKCCPGSVPSWLLESCRTKIHLSSDDNRLFSDDNWLFFR